MAYVAFGRTDSSWHVVLGDAGARSRARQCVSDRRSTRNGVLRHAVADEGHGPGKLISPVRNSGSSGSGGRDRDRTPVRSPGRRRGTCGGRFRPYTGSSRDSVPADGVKIRKPSSARSGHAVHAAALGTAGYLGAVTDFLAWPGALVRRPWGFWRSAAAAGHSSFSSSPAPRARRLTCGKGKALLGLPTRGHSCRLAPASFLEDKPVKELPADGLVVAVLTYRRPADIALALPRLIGPGRKSGAHDVRRRSTVLVIDNDPAASARELVEWPALSGVVSYVHEATAGIAAARNRALSSPFRTGAARLHRRRRNTVGRLAGEPVGTYERQRRCCGGRSGGQPIRERAGTVDQRRAVLSASTPAHRNRTGRLPRQTICFWICSRSAPQALVR